MDDAPQTRQLPLPQAAIALGLSRRTVERRLASGKLSGVKVGFRWLVDTPIEHKEPQPPPEPPEEPTVVLQRRIDVLTAQVADLTREVAVLTTTLTATSGERDYLRGMAAALTSRVPQLPARAPEPAPRRRWWQRR